MKNILHIAMSIFLLSPIVGLTGSALAQEQGPLVGSPPVMKETLWREGRIELAPTFAATLGDVYEEHFIPGLSISYFPLDWIGVGVDMQYAIGFDTNLQDQINAELRLKRDSVCPAGPLNALGEGKLQQCLDILGVDDTIATRSIETMTTAFLQLVPFRGKAMMFNHVLQYDIHLLAGFGFATLRGEGGLENATSVAPMAGIGTRWFVNDWVTLVFQGRDVLLNYAPATDQDGREMASEFSNHFEVLMGVGFVLPQAPRFR